MASNSFGQIFKITTFGESHGLAIGVVIDGCPSGLELCVEEINDQLKFRRPGSSLYTSPRKEIDCVEIISGVFQGKTTGAPITILIRNMDVDSKSYDNIKDCYRPGHANYTYLEKYGIFDYRGGGRSSARETAVRVAAGVVAKKILFKEGIQVIAYLQEMGDVCITTPSFEDFQILREKVYTNPIFCPCDEGSLKMIKQLEKIIEKRDSLGGVVGCVAKVPVGLGDPVYCKLEALLAYAMLSIPASKGFEIGSGFAASKMTGSAHNDLFDLDEEGNLKFTTNFAGGVLGGISTGEALYFRTAFKPTSSIKRNQSTVNIKNEKVEMQISESSRHDPCVAIRAVPVVEAMASIVLADCVLMNKVANFFKS